MNKRTVMASLNKIANELDKNGLFKEANTNTKVMTRLAEDGEGDWRDSLLTDDQRKFLEKQDSVNSFLENRDSFLTPSQKSVVQKSKDMESIFNMFEQYADEILNKQGHSGFSSSFLKGQVGNYFAATDAEKPQMMSHFERKSQEGESINQRMNTHILEFLQFAQEFQNEHDVPDSEMRSFVKAL
jgi:hypothetical protein